MRGTAFAGCKVGSREQAQNVELCLELHIVDNILIRKILHHENDVTGERAEFLRQAGEGFASESLDFVQGGGNGVGPVHGLSIGIADMLAQTGMEGMP